MKRFPTILIVGFLLLLPGYLPAAEIKGPEKVAQYKLVKLSVELPDKAAVKWDVYPRGTADVDKTVRGQLIFTGPPGTYEVTATVIAIKDGAVDFEESTKTVVIGDGTPGPGPGPTPPTPGPGPVANLRVLIVYESADLTTYPAAQQNVLYGKAVRDALDAATPLGPDGKTHEWNIWDKDVDASAMPKPWGDLLKRPRTKTPWVIFASGDGTVAYEGPLPANPQDMLTLIGKYAPKSAPMKKAG